MVTTEKAADRRLRLAEAFRNNRVSESHHPEDSAGILWVMQADSQIVDPGLRELPVAENDE